MSDPSHPAEKTVFAVSGGHTNRIHTTSKRAYVADGWAGAKVLDLTDPLVPTVLGRYQDIVEAYEIKPFGKYAVVANRGELRTLPGTYQGGIRILDLSALPAEPVDPTDPTDPATSDAMPMLTVGAKRFTK